jgi:hypothetical protein
MIFFKIVFGGFIQLHFLTLISQSICETLHYFDVEYKNHVIWLQRLFPGVILQIFFCYQHSRLTNTIYKVGLRDIFQMNKFSDE